MEALTTSTLIDAAYALGIGLFVGLEREHSGAAEGAPPAAGTGEEPPTAACAEDPPLPRDDQAMGVRTFAIISLLGWSSGYVGAAWSWIPPVALAIVGTFIGLQYALLRRGDVGLTTETAGVMAFILGLLVNLDRGLAAALALATTVLLISKPWFRRTVPKLRRVELSGTLQLLILLAIVLPLLPAEPLDPWEALPPRRIGLFVILVAGLSYVGYILARILGEKRSASLTGILGGLASSTALTVAMSRIGREERMRAQAQLAVFLANAIMFGRVMVLTGVISRVLFQALALPLGVMGAVMLLGALWRWRTLGEAGGGAAENAVDQPPLKNPFALLPALKWGAVLSGVLLLAHFARELAGERGLLAAAAAAGLADVDAITLAVSAEAAGRTLPIGTAATAVTIAVMVNTVVKAAMAWVGGGRALGTPIAGFFLATIAAGGAAMLLF